MKKILFPILTLAIVLGMSNCEDEKNDNPEDNLVTLPDGTKVDPETGLTPDGFYPYEVTNIKHERTGIATARITWDNPTDNNFSYVETIPELYRPQIYILSNQWMVI